MFSSADDIIAFIKEEGVKFVDVRFCDLPGVMQHFNVPASTVDAIQSFIDRWASSEASERGNYQLFLTELCDLLGVEKAKPASANVLEATYTFERPVIFNDGEGKTTTNFIDLYKRYCFVLEAKLSDRVHSGIGVLLKKTEELGLSHKTDLARFYHFGGGFVDGVRN